ncbi:MAG: nuclear transport factor 2 family protein [Telluria sp.]
MTSKFLVAQFAAAVTLCGGLMLPVQAAPDAVVPVTELVRQFTNAQVTMDGPTLAALTAENYVEVSPLGDVDPREKMLTFYVKDEKSAALPPVTLEDMAIRVLGDTAVVIAKISYSKVIQSQSRAFSLRSTFVAEKVGGAWKMVSVQYTPIHPSRNPG